MPVSKKALEGLLPAMICSGPEVMYPFYSQLIGQRSSGAPTQPLGGVIIPIYPVEGTGGPKILVGWHKSILQGQYLPVKGQTASGTY